METMQTRRVDRGAACSGNIIDSILWRKLVWCLDQRRTDTCDNNTVQNSVLRDARTGAGIEVVGVT